MIFGAIESNRKRRWARSFGWLPFVLLIGTGAAFSQGLENTGAPNIQILKLRWEKQVRLPRSFDPSVIPTGSTFSDPTSRSSVPASSIDTTRVASPTRTPAANSNLTFPATPGRLPVFYVYSLKIRNIGPKAIEGLAWDYSFVDPDSNTELGRHQFLSYAKAPTNKNLELHGQLRSPPVRVVRASVQKAQPKFIERAVIECVLYADDTVWRNPHAGDGVCESLKDNKPVKKPKHRDGT